ncbi:MAG TPA: SRPBCC domain-containing protein [Gemmatimonadaceae bacterium]
MLDTPPPPEQSITVVRTISAPVSSVFAAWTTPELLRQWLAPAFCKVIEVTADARPGGAYRIVVQSPFGGKTITFGEYREIIPDRRIVKTWVLEGRSPVANYHTLVTVDFRALGPASTEITILQEGLKTKVDRAGNRGGWNSCLKKLAASLKS